MTMTKDMENAIKLIAGLRPENVEPASLINVGGIKVISNPMLPHDTIIISDNVWLDLKQIAEMPK